MADDIQKQFNILIVDDNSKNIQVVAGLLKGKGYKMSFAKEGKTALSHAQNTDFDLILLDVMMPEMDGFEVCEKLKQDPATQDVPVIFLTARTDTESLVKGFQVGGADYVAKPFQAEELLARVGHQLELRRAKMALKTSNQRLTDAIDAKDKFFSIIAHDLKSPFNALLTGTMMLLQSFEDMDDAMKKEFILEIHNAADNTYNLLENLLNWSRSQTGAIQCKPELLDISHKVLETMALMSKNAMEKDIRLINTVDPGAEAQGDPDMIQTVIRNLVANALKYTHAGGEIRISAEPVGSFLQISVADTGLGMDESDLAKLFRIDVKNSTLGTANEQGTGLGLALCKEFVEQNNGRIWAESKKGRGSRFFFTLPVQSPPKQKGSGDNNC